VLEITPRSPRAPGVGTVMSTNKKSENKMKKILAFFDSKQNGSNFCNGEVLYMSLEIWNKIEVLHCTRTTLGFISLIKCRNNLNGCTNLIPTYNTPNNVDILLYPIIGFRIDKAMMRA
jgi:hypothetical protein